MTHHIQYDDKNSFFCLLVVYCTLGVVIKLKFIAFYILVSVVLL